MMSIGLLIIRLVIGVVIHWSRCTEIIWLVWWLWIKRYRRLDGINWIKPGVTMALLAGLAEFIGGVLFTLGLLTPLAGIMIAGTMVMAIVKGACSKWIIGQQKMDMNII